MILSLDWESLGGLIKANVAVSTEELKCRQGIFLNIFPEVRRHGGEALQEKLNIEDKMILRPLRLDELP